MPPAVNALSGVSTFRALRHRNFRLLWVGLILSAVGTWMQIVAQSLVVLKLSHGSAFALGTVSLAQALSFFCFAPLGGSFADRYDKRKLLLLTQSLMMALAFVLAALTWTSAIRLWMIVALAFASGTVLSFDQPTRNSLVSFLVPPEDLMNAISLQAVVFNGASTIGPALAGIVAGAIGYAGSFFLNGVSFLFVLLALWMLRLPADPPPELRRAPLWDSIGEALSTIRRDTVLPAAISAYAAMLFFGPSASLLLPVYATQVLHLPPAHLGILFSALGAGTVLGALGVATLGDFRHKGLLLLGCYGAWTATFILFAESATLWPSMFALLLLGASQNAAGAATITLLQSRVPSPMRGRVMSLNTLLIMGVRPLGDFPAGALIVVAGARFTAVLSACLVGIYSLWVFISRPALRRS